MLFTEFNVEDALEVRFEEGVQEGKQKGQQMGQDAMLRLVNAMIADGRSEELGKLQQDLEFRKSMFERYHINEV